MVIRKIVVAVLFAVAICVVGCGEKTDPATAEKETQKQATEQSGSGENK